MIGGGIWPVVHRELRAGARRPLIHWLRVAGAFGGVAVFWLTAGDTPFTNVGSQIFFRIHRLLILSILCVVPAITADSIARERREGTLGLLFMTPLHSSEIVIGKVVVQVLRSLTLWLAVIPVLTIPFLAGGVTLRELASLLGAEFCIGVFCLAAGIVASSLAEKRGSAFILAFAFAATLVFGLTEERGWILLRPSSYMQTVVVRNWIGKSTGTMFNGATGLYYSGWTGPALMRPPGAPTSPLVPLWPVAERLLFAVLVLWAAIRFAGFRVEKSWQDKIAEPVADGNLARACREPVFRRQFAHRMRRTLEWNPIAWLQQYSWRARLTKWGLCLAFTVLICMASDDQNFAWIAQRGTLVFAIMAAAYTYAGVNGFLQEKKTGALELILITPLKVNQIIFGRVWGLWTQFFPAALMLAVCYHALHWFDPFRHSGLPNYYGLRSFPDGYGLGPFADYFLGNNALMEFALVVGFLSLPVYATLAALRLKNIVLAAAWTWLALLAAPAFGALVGLAAALVPRIVLGVPYIFDVEPTPAWVYFGILASHAAFVRLALRNLRQRLAQRDYAF